MSTGDELAWAEGPVWHDVECGGYGADLPLWRALADGAPGRVLELGAGTGRVSLRLARGGSEVTAIELDPALAAEIERRAERDGVAVEVRGGDLLELPASGEFALVLAPMQLLQMLDPGDRPAALRAVAAHLRPGAVAALAIVEPDALQGDDASPPLPDIREIDGWVYSSRPLWVSEEGDSVLVKRLREAVSPQGEVERAVFEERLALLDADRLEDEAAAAGLRPRERRRIDNGPQEADSTVVVLEREGS